jgi:hypothetical protein
MADETKLKPCPLCAQMARTLQHLIKTEGLDAAYVWLGEVAMGDEPEFSRPGDAVHET